MKTLHELLDAWENGTLTAEELKQLKELLNDPAVRAEARMELSLYGLLNTVLRDESLKPVEAAEAAETTSPAPDLAQFERGFASPAAKARAMLLRYFGWLARPAVAWALVILFVVSSGATYYFWPRPIAYFSDPGQGTGIDHSGKVLRALAGGKIYSGDSIHVYMSSAAIQLLGEKTSIYMGPETDVQLLGGRKGKTLKMELGSINAKVATQPANRPFRVAAPNATVTVKGTTFTFRVWTNGTYVHVVEGAVELRETGKTPIIVLPAHYAVTGMRGAPLKSAAAYGLKRQVWVAGTAPLAKDVPTSQSEFIFEDYAFRTQTMMWEYPFLADKSKTYRERFVGYFKAPETADYTFWVISQAASELWFSPIGPESNKVLIASTPAPSAGAKLSPTWNYSLTPANQKSPPAGVSYSKYPSQKSAPQHLEEGKSYYIEALHEAVPEDFMMIIWAPPGMDLPYDVIAGQYLMPVKPMP